MDLSKYTTDQLMSIMCKLSIGERGIYAQEIRVRQSKILKKRHSLVSLKEVLDDKRAVSNIDGSHRHST